MLKSGHPPVRRSSILAALVFAGVLTSVGLQPAAAAPPAQAVAVDGLAYNYYTNVSLFGGPYMRRGFGQVTCDAANLPAGCAPAGSAVESTSPSVVCPPNGGNPTATDPDGARAVYGPAAIFSGQWPEANSTAPPSGPLTSSIDCQLGQAGHVAASTDVTLMPPGTMWDPPPQGGATQSHPGGVGPGPFIADGVNSSCNATTTGVTGATTIADGTLETSYYTEDDPLTLFVQEQNGDVKTSEPVPTTPPANYTRNGTIDHVGDSYSIVFNEQVANPDGSVTINAAHMYLLGPTAVGDMVIGSSTCGPLTTGLLTQRVVDFDGDVRSDLAVFRPAEGVWYSRLSSTTATTGTAYGSSTDATVPADYDGDGKTDIAIFRAASGLWAIHRSGDNGDTFVTYGVGGDIPVPGDYDGDGKADISVYRPSTGTWFVHRSSDNVDAATTFGGIGGDIAVPADYDGDAKADLAIFRPASAIFHVHPTGGGPDTAVGWGTDGDVPIVGDYDGDAKADVAIFRPSSGLWAVNRSAGGQTLLTYGGVEGDIPVPADYDGDGKTDVAIFRAPAGAWFVRHSLGGADTVTTFGIPADVPLQLPYSVRSAF